MKTMLLLPKTIKALGFSLKSVMLTCLMGLTLLFGGERANAAVYYWNGSTYTTLTNWTTLRAGGGTTPSNFTTAGDVFIIQGTGATTNGTGTGASNQSLTTTATWTIGSSSNNTTLEVEGGATLTTNGSYYLTIGSAATFVLDAASNLNLGISSTSVSNTVAGTESWNSTATITYTTSYYLTQSNITGNAYPNLVLSLSSASNKDIAGAITTVNGNLTIGTNTGKVFYINKSGGTTLTVAGNLTISGATTGLDLFAPTGTTNTLNVGGNISIASGSYLTQSSSGTGAVYFTKSGISTYTDANASGAGIAAKPINFIVNSGCTLDMGTNIIGPSTGTFMLNSGAGIITANTNATGALTTSGTNGSIQVTGTRTYNAGAYYTFNAASAQVTGNGLTGANNLTINNASGVTLTSATTVSGILALTSGILTTTTTNLLTLGTASTISGASATAYVSGPLKWNLPIGTSTKYTYPVGTSSAYLPFDLTFTTTAATSDAQVQATTGAFTPTYDATLGSVSGSEYWTLTTTGTVFTSLLGSVGKSALGSYTLIGKATTASTGSYTSIGGGTGVTVGGINGIGVSTAITSTPATAGVFYLALGTVAGTPSIALTDNGTVSAGNIVASSTKNALLPFTLTNTGTGQGIVNSVAFTTTGTATGTDLTNFKLYYSTSSTGLSTATLLSTLTAGAAGTYTFTGLTQAIAATSGVGYFWITADVAASPTLGNTVAVNATPTITLASTAVSGSTSAGGVQTIIGLPTVTTTTATSITVSGASAGGNVTSAGGASVSTKGTAYSTSTSPTTGTSDGTGTGSFTSTISSLTANTVYYYRAYATNLGGTAYGTEYNFTTLPNAPTVGVGGTIIASGFTANWTAPTGGAAAYTYSLEYTTDAAFLTGITTVTGISSASTSYAITSLSPATTYYYRVTAVNATGSSAASSISSGVTTLGPSVPTLTTTAISSINTTTASSGGTVSDNGGSAVTVEGICWSTSTGPTTANSITTDGTATPFTSSLTGLTPGVTYYVRAYATNGIGIGYGNEVSFTALTTPATQASAISFSGITTSTLTLTWTRGSGANVAVFVKAGSGTITNPSDGTAYTASTTLGTGSQLGTSGYYCVYNGTGTTVSLVGLTGATTYSVQAFEYNGSGTGTLYNTTTATNNPNSQATSAPVSAATDYFRSGATGNWGTAATWQTSADGSTNWITSTLVPTSSAKGIEIASGTTVTVAASLTTPVPTVVTSIQVNGTLAIGSGFALTMGGNIAVNSGGTLTVTGSTAASLVTTGQVLTVNGTLTNTSTLATAITSSATTLSFGAGSNYTHNLASGTTVAQIPAATWASTATASVTGSTTAMTTTGITAGTPSSAGLGNVTINLPSLTGASKLIGGSWATGNGYIFQGNLSILTGHTTATQITTGAPTFTIGGDLIVSGGNQGFMTYANTAIFNVNGNLNITGGTLTLASLSGAVGTINVKGNVSVSSGATLAQTVGTANIVFNGSSAQTITNSGTISGTINYTVNNSAGVSLLSNLSVVGTLTLTTGNLSIGTHNLTLTSAVAGTPSASKHIVTGSTGYVTTSAAPSAYTFPVGFDATNYNPVTITSSQIPMVIASAISPSLSNSLKAEWIIGGITSSSTLAFPWNSTNDITGTAQTSGEVYKYNGSTWASIGGSTSGTSPSYTTTATETSSSVSYPYTVGPASPTITLTNNAAAQCAGVTTNNIAYSATTGSPDKYSIDWNAAANTAGFTDVSLATLSSSPIVLAIPSGAPAGTYTGTLTVTNTTATSTSYTITDTIQASPTISSQSTAAVNYALNGTATALSVTATGAGLTYQWYSNGTASNTGGALISGAISASYTPLTTALGTTYYYCVVSGTCSPTDTSAVSGAITIASASPTLTAATGATVDAPFAITFTDDVAWRGVITAVKVGNDILPSGAYSFASGTLTLTPAASAYLQTAGTYTITVLSTGYADATVSQTIAAGVATNIVVSTQPTAPATNGGALAVQPVLTIKDQYNNTVTTSTATVTAAISGGTWVIGGTANVNAASGIVTFSGLTAGTSDGSSLSGATITFSSTGLTGVTSSSFVIPAYVTVSTDYFKSNVATGDWATAGSWLSSPDNINWYTASLAPTSAATSVSILNGHTITNANAAITTTNTTIKDGGKLIIQGVLTVPSGKTLTIDADAGNGGGTLEYQTSLSASASDAPTITGSLVVNGNYIVNPTTIANIDATDQAAGYIPTTNVTWAATSILTIKRLPTTDYLRIGSSIAGSVVFDVQTGTDGMAAGYNYLNASGLTFGALTIKGTGSGSLSQSTGGTARTLIVTNNVSVAGGIYSVVGKTGTAAATLTVNGNVSVSAGTLTTSSSSGSSTASTTIKGNVTISGGTFTNYTGTGTGARLFLAGTSAQSITASGTYTVGSFTVNNSAGVTLNSDLTVGGTLIMTSGIVTTGANKLIIASTGTVSGASSSSYVNGYLEKYIPASATTAIFEIGDASNYTPVTTAFTGTITAATGNITANTTAGDHAQIATSGINSSLSVNRTWTLTNGTAIPGLTSYAPTFTYVSGNNDASTTPANYVVRLYSGSAWVATTISGTPTTTGASATGISLFGDFAIGEPASLTVTTQPTATTTCLGSTAGFTSASTSVPTPTVKWQRSTDNLTYVDIDGTLDGGIYSNYTTGTLAITGATAGVNGYYYRAVFTNINGSVNSTGVTLTVSTLPTLGGTSVSATAVCEGSTPTISLTGLEASSSVSITYHIGSDADQLASVTADALGDGSFSTVALTAANSGATLTITSITRTSTTPSCSATISSNNTAAMPTINATPASPVFSLGSTSSRCQGAGSVTYTATATYPTGITISYSLDATTSAHAGNSIDTGTGEVTYAADWSGTTTVTATATSTTGCGSPVSSDHTVTTNATSTPTFISATATVMLNDVGTYTTESGKTNYDWTFPGSVLGTDYNIVSGGTSADNTVTVRWLTLSGKTVAINYGCVAASATTTSVTIVSNIVFKSKQTGDWDVIGIWTSSTDGGASWPDASVTPPSYAKVIIADTHTVTIPSAVTPTVKNLHINSNAKLINDGTLTIGDSVVLASDNTYTAQLLNNGTVNNNGVVKLEKSMISGGWYFMDFPFDVSASNITKADGTALTNNTDYYVKTYDGASRDSGGAPNITGVGKYWIFASLPLSKNTGYIVAADVSMKIAFTSAANETSLFASTASTTVSKYTTNASITNHNWNMKGNPFSSSFDLLNASQEHAPFYVFDGSTYQTIMEGDSYNIYPFTSFFLQAFGYSNTLDFANAGRLLKAATIADANYDEVELYIDNGTATDKVRIRINDAATGDFDPRLDGLKFLSTVSSTPQLYSLYNGNALSVNSLPIATSGATTVPLSVYIPSVGSYSIRLANPQKIKRFGKVLLTDADSGTSTDLLQTNTYTLAGTTSGTTNTRLALILETTTTSVASGGINNSNISVRESIGNLYICGLESEAEVALYDVSGRLFHKYSKVQNNEAIPVGVDGVYIVSVRTKGQDYHTKVVVNGK